MFPSSLPNGNERDNDQAMNGCCTCNSIESAPRIRRLTEEEEGEAEEDV